MEETLSAVAARYNLSVAALHRHIGHAAIRRPRRRRAGISLAAKVEAWLRQRRPADLEAIFADLQTAEAFELVLEGVDAAVDKNPIEGLQRARDIFRLATAIGDKNAKARALCPMANANRAIGRYDVAHRILALADRLCTEDAVRGMIARRRGYLYGTQGNHQEEIRELERSISIFRELNDSDGEGRSLLFRGISRRHTGDRPGAITDAQHALELLDPKRSQRFRAAAKFNLVVALATSPSHDDILKALSQIPSLRILVDKTAGRESVFRAKLLWVEGLLAERIMASRKAERHLLRARELFMKLGMAQETHAITADLLLLKSHSRRALRSYLRKLDVEIQDSNDHAMKRHLAEIFEATRTDNPFVFSMARPLAAIREMREAFRLQGWPNLEILSTPTTTEIASPGW